MPCSSRMARGDFRTPPSWWIGSVWEDPKRCQRHAGTRRCAACVGAGTAGQGSARIRAGSAVRARCPCRIGVNTRAGRACAATFAYTLPDTVCSRCVSGDRCPRRAGRVVSACYKRRHRGIRRGYRSIRVAGPAGPATVSWLITSQARLPKKGYSSPCSMGYLDNAYDLRKRNRFT